MHILYLKAPDRASLEAALENAGITEDGAPADPRYLLDVIGIIHEPTGETASDADGAEYPVMEPIDGFHANLAIRWPLTGDPGGGVQWLSAEALAALDPITMVAPSTPIRVWA